MRQLAKIAQHQLGDPGRAERYLVEVTRLAPRREDYEALLSIYGDDPQHVEGRRAVLGGLLALGGPYMARLVELSRLLVGQGQRRWAWCLLSPLMSATIPDAQLKALVLELRKEFEKGDHTVALTPDLHEKARHPDVDAKLLAILAEVDAAVPVGPATIEDLGATGTSKLDERTAVGKTFAALAQRLGAEGVQLWRAQELSQPWAILDGETPQVVVRAELLQLMSPPETGFLFATLVEMTRPGARLLASLGTAPGTEDRARVAQAIWAAVGLAEADARVQPLAQKIKETVPAARLQAWAQDLAGAGSPAERVAHTWRGVEETARRVGLIAAADLRFVARLLTRLDESLPKMPTVGKVEDLEAFFDNAGALHPLIGFAASPGFGQFLAN
jgi:hypothetical protein